MTKFQICIMRDCAMLIVALFMVSCTSSISQELSVKNHLDIERYETIAIPIESLDTLLKKQADRIIVKDLDGNKIIISQLIDVNDDGVMDEILFQSLFAPKQELKFSLEIAKEKLPQQVSSTTYARLVPERIDDFAWENDLVAFRTYGPEAQRLVDEGEKGGTLSSGIDCWLKRVDYPIINKWYKKYVDGGSYHNDDGEGYDPYHVGISRGCGGTGVWQNDSLFVSKNFTSAKVIDNGPVRTTFELQYAAWDVNGISLRERKRISINAGSQFYNMKVWLSSSAEIPNLTVGVTLHDKKGVAKIDSLNGWVSYWEPMDDSMLGTGVVIDPKYASRYIDFRTPKKDLSHLYIITNPAEDHLEYFGGFAWKKSGWFNSAEEWDRCLLNKSKTLASPLEIVFIR